MAELIESSGMKTLYFVVPSGPIFDAFNEQNFVTQTGTVAISKSKHVQSLKQFVLAIPLTTASSSTGKRKHDDKDNEKDDHKEPPKKKLKTDKSKKV